MKIYTRGGDRGETTLLGGARVSKDDPRVRAYGAVDELNANLGLALALDEPGHLGDAGDDDSDAARLLRVQSDLLAVGAWLASVEPEKLVKKGTIPKLEPERVEELEAWIDALDVELPALDSFVLSGGGPVGAQLHVARTVNRRAERAIVDLLVWQSELSHVILPYLNRLSDLLFTLARAANHRAGREEAEWTPQRRREADE